MTAETNNGRALDLTPPTEEAEQMALMQWVSFVSGRMKR